MFNCHVFTERQARPKNIPPAHSTTGVLNRNSSHRETDLGIHCSTGTPGIHWPMARNRTGMVRARPIQNLRASTRVSVVVLRPGGGGFGFQRHTALRAVTRMVLLDFRMHRAGVNGFARGGGPRRIALQRHAAFRTVTRPGPIPHPDTSDKSTLRWTPASLNSEFGIRNSEFPGISAGNVRCRKRTSLPRAWRAARTLHPRSCHKWGRSPSGHNLRQICQISRRELTLESAPCTD